MPRYSLAVFPQIIVRIDGIEAGNHLEAIGKAEAVVFENRHMFERGSDELDKEGAFTGHPRVRYTELAEERIACTLVDEEGDQEYLLSEWYEPGSGAGEYVPSGTKDKREAAAIELVKEFLADQETLNEPYRNEAICDRARQFLKKVCNG